MRFETLKKTALTTVIGLGLSIPSNVSSNAGTFTNLITLPTPLMAQSSEILEVKHRKKRLKRRLHRRHKHLRRHHRRRHKRRHYHRHHYYDLWDVIPYLVEPHYSTPHYHGNRCDYWSNQCYRNWGGGSNYLGCMQYHHCL